MTLTTLQRILDLGIPFQMPVRSMTLTTYVTGVVNAIMFQMPVRSMTLTTLATAIKLCEAVSDACQINDFDHRELGVMPPGRVSDACQINDFDHIP